MGAGRAPDAWRTASRNLSESLQRTASSLGDTPDQAGRPDYVVRFTENVEPTGVAGVDEWFVVNATRSGVEVYSVVSSRGPVTNERLSYDSDWTSKVEELFVEFRRALEDDRSTLDGETPN
jgi:hypothetical protein